MDEYPIKPPMPQLHLTINLQEGRFEEAALLRSRQVELVEALTAAVDAGPRLPRVRNPTLIVMPC